MTDTQYWRREIKWVTEQIEFAERQMLFWFTYRRSMGTFSYADCREKFYHYRDMRKRFQRHLVRLTSHYLRQYKS